MIAAFQGNSQDGDKLLSTARGLANAVRNLLKSAEPSESQNRKQILDAAAEVGVTGGLLLALMGDPDVSKEVQDTLLEKARAVAMATSRLVQNAKTVAGKCADSTLQASVIAATEGGLSCVAMGNGLFVGFVCSRVCPCVYLSVHVFGHVSFYVWFV